MNNVSAHVPTPALKGASPAAAAARQAQLQVREKQGVGGMEKLVSVPLVHVHQQCGVVVVAAAVL